jgi:hypothetical protein
MSLFCLVSLTTGDKFITALWIIVFRTSCHFYDDLVLILLGMAKGLAVATLAIWLEVFHIPLFKTEL